MIMQHQYLVYSNVYTLDNNDNVHFCFTYFLWILYSWSILGLFVETSANAQ